MPLGEKSANRDRGWSMDSLDSTEDRVVFAGSKTNAIHPRRQPRSAPSEARAQADEGFARFLQQHSSPTHQRVTAGGRIVPMGPTLAAPPEFNMPTDNLSRANDNNNHSVREMADAAKLGNERPVFPMNINTGNMTANPNAENLTARSRGSRQSAYSSHEQIGETGQDNHVITNAESLKKGNPLPRRSDLPHVTSPASTTIGLYQRSVNATSAFNPNHPTLNQTTWNSLALPMSTMVFDPYTNMLVTSGEYNPIMPTSTMPAAPNSSLFGTDQMACPADLVDDSHYISQQGVQPAMWATYQPAMPLHSTAYHQLPYSASASMINHNGMSSMASAQSGFAPQMDSRSQASSEAQLPAFNTSFNAMSMNNASTQASTDTGHITEEKVKFAEMVYNRIDSRLRNHDQYSACNYSTFTNEVKNIHAKERLSLAEERNKARRHWQELKNLLDAGRSVLAPQQQLRSVQHFVPTLSTNHHQTSSYQGGNGNLNSRASAWTPDEMNQGNGGAMHLQSADPYAHNSSIMHNSGHPSSMHNSGHPSTSMRINSYPANPPSNEINMQLVASSPSAAMPGPYSEQWNNLNPNVQLDQDIGEWGTLDRQAPRQLAKKQSEQDLKLAKVHPETRSQVSFEELESLPSAHGYTNAPLSSNNVNSRKTVSFAENETNTAQRIAHDGDDGASDAPSYDESTWSPMLADEDTYPEPEEWAAIKAASNKEYGVETRIYTVSGKLITIKGGRPPGLFFATDTASQNHGARTYHSVRFDRHRNSMTNQMMRTAGNGRRAENVRAPQGGQAFPGGRRSQGRRRRQGGRAFEGARGLEGLGYRGMHAFDGRPEYERARGYGSGGSEGAHGFEAGRASEGGRGSEGGRVREEDVSSAGGDITPKASSSVLSAWAKTDESNVRRNKAQSSVAIQNVTAPGMMPGFEGATARFGGWR
jgi:hypothetical protein